DNDEYLMFILIGDVEQIYDSINKTFGYNFIMINDQLDFSLKNNHDSHTLVIKEFVQKK
ncbi:7850_t:CDS:1, partial [Cetraspora pellucida]